jgi:hypothetical protein
LVMIFCIQITGSLSAQITVGTLQVKHDLYQIKTYVYRVYLIPYGSRMCASHKMSCQVLQTFHQCVCLFSRDDNVRPARDYFRQQHLFHNRVIGTFSLQLNTIQNG